jgi:hypothetical protein
MVDKLRRLPPIETKDTSDSPVAVGSAPSGAALAQQPGQVDDDARDRPRNKRYSRRAKEDAPILRLVGAGHTLVEFFDFGLVVMRPDGGGGHDGLLLAGYGEVPAPQLPSGLAPGWGPACPPVG